jgi:hypothetical protein
MGYAHFKIVRFNYYNRVRHCRVGLGPLSMVSKFTMGFLPFGNRSYVYWTASLSESQENKQILFKRNADPK